MRTARTLRLATVLAVFLSPGLARAGFVLSAVDTPAVVSGVDPANDLPNSFAEFTAFSRAAGQIGPLVTTNFGDATGSLTRASIGDGVSVTLSGAKADPNSLVTSGVVSTNPNLADGFNVTSTGGTFLRLTPDVSGTSATASFTFARPVQGFGVYLMGLGTAPGTFQMQVYDGGQTGPNSSTYQLASVPPGRLVTPGGVQYLDFIDTGSSFSRVDFRMTGFSATSRDIVGFDGLSFVTAIPEPSPAVLLAVGGSILLGTLYLARARDRGR